MYQRKLEWIHVHVYVNIYDCIPSYSKRELLMNNQGSNNSIVWWTKSTKSCTGPRNFWVLGPAVNHSMTLINSLRYPCILASRALLKYVCYVMRWVPVWYPCSPPNIIPVHHFVSTGGHDVQQSKTLNRTLNIGWSSFCALEAEGVQEHVIITC